MHQGPNRSLNVLVQHIYRWECSWKCMYYFLEHAPKNVLSKYIWRLNRSLMQMPHLTPRMTSIILTLLFPRMVPIDIEEFENLMACAYFHMSLNLAYIVQFLPYWISKGVCLEFENHFFLRPTFKIALMCLRLQCFSWELPMLPINS